MERSSSGCQPVAIIVARAVSGIDALRSSPASSIVGRVTRWPSPADRDAMGHMSGGRLGLSSRPTAFEVRGSLLPVGGFLLVGTGGLGSSTGGREGAHSDGHWGTHLWSLGPPFSVKACHGVHLPTGDIKDAPPEGGTPKIAHRANPTVIF